MMTYEEILDRCLEKIPNDIDKREGGLVHTILAPLCFELSQAYFEVENTLSLSFVDSSYGVYLDQVAKTFGIDRLTAKKCRKSASIQTTLNIIGQKFNASNYIFEVIEKIGDNKYIIEADSYDHEFNQIFGELQSIYNLEGVSYANIIENIVFARDEETDEELRKRVYDRIYAKPFGGNVADYTEKALSIGGIYYVKVFTSRELGVAGDVHLVVAGLDKKPLDSNILANCLNTFVGDLKKLAIAPIGHNVSVSTSEYLDITLSFNVTLKSYENTANTTNTIRENIKKVIDNVEFDESNLSNMKIIASIFNDSNIIDVKNFKINNSTSDIVLKKTKANFQVLRIQNIIINYI